MRIKRHFLDSMETSRDDVENCILTVSSALLSLMLVYFPCERLKLFLEWPAQQAGPLLFQYSFTRGVI